jgi:hypothetical protein
VRDIGVDQQRAGVDRRNRGIVHRSF